MLMTGFEDNIQWARPFVASVLTSSGPIFSESTLPWPFRLWPGHSKHRCFLNRGVSNKRLPDAMCQNFVVPGYGHKPRKCQKRKGRFWNSILFILFENVPLLYPRKPGQKETVLSDFSVFRRFLLQKRCAGDISASRPVNKTQAKRYQNQTGGKSQAPASQSGRVTANPLARKSRPSMPRRVPAELRGTPGPGISAGTWFSFIFRNL